MPPDSLFQRKTLTQAETENITRVEELAYELKVEEVMTPSPVTVSPQTSMSAVLELFRQNRISGAPVLDSGKLVGLVSIEDLLKCLQKADQPASHSAWRVHARWRRAGQKLFDGLLFWCRSSQAKSPAALS